MPKKQRNSFYFFMVDYKQQQEDQGRRFNGGLRDIQDEAGEIWKSMPTSARAKYEKKAKDYKSGPQGRKFTSTGEPIDVVQKRKMEAEEAEKLKRESVVNLVCDRKTATEKIFFVIDVNYYCQTKDLFVINEVSIVAFNIYDGMNMVFHKIIDPVRIPLGFTSCAKESEEEHGFKLPPLANGESNPAVVLSEMLDFFQTVNADHPGAIPDGPGAIPLFTLEERSKPVESFLEQMCDIYDDVSQFVLYPMSTLFYALSQKLSTTADKAMPNESVAHIALKADKFQYCPNLACAFHEETEKYYNCTKSRAKRWAFTVLDYCYPLAGVEPVSGDHLPDDIDPTEAYRVKMKREEEREKALREERGGEEKAGFSFIDYAKLDERERQHRDALGARFVPVVPANASAYGSAFPSLGAPAARAPIVKPSGAWGKPASAPAASPSPRPVSAASSTAPPKRPSLRKPGHDAEQMLVAELSSTGTDSIGITRGRGRGSITSLYSN